MQIWRLRSGLRVLDSSAALSLTLPGSATMQLYGALIVFMTLSTVCGLRCYTCTLTDPKSCTDSKSCPFVFNRCFSLRAEGYNLVTKGCQSSTLCIDPMVCCVGDLCNGATPTGPSVLLLLASSALIALLL